jgi:alpha-glucosidase
VEPAHVPLAVDRQTDDADSVLAFTRRWLAWRRDQAELKTGPLTLLDLPGRTLAYLRGEGPKTLLFIFNLDAEETMTTALPAGAWTSVFDLGASVDGDKAVLPPGTAFAARLG